MAGQPLTRESNTGDNSVMQAGGQVEVGHIGRSSVRTGGVHLLLRILHGRSSDGPSDHASVTTGAPVLVCLIALLAPSVQGINASPAPIALRQPDGAAIQLHIRGDEFCHWFEDERGYAVVRDREAYVYARADADGRMVPTALRVGRHDPESAGLKIGLRPSPGIRRGTSPAARLPAREISVADAATPEIPASSIMAAGVVRNLVILCKFKDHDLATKTRTSNDFDVIFNRVGGDPTLAPSGSVRDYFTEASYGVIDLQSTVLAWVTLPSNEAYYADGQDGLGSYPKNSQRMVEDALNLVDPVVDFGQFDANNDGYVDAIDIIHSGYGAETGGGGRKLDLVASMVAVGTPAPQVDQSGQECQRGKSQCLRLPYRGGPVGDQRHRDHAHRRDLPRDRTFSRAPRSLRHRWIERGGWLLLFDGQCVGVRLHPTTSTAPLRLV